MNRLAQFVVTRAWLAWSLIILVAVAVGIGSNEFVRRAAEKERTSLLEIEAERTSLEVMSQTLNGTVMGSMAMLGLIDFGFKQEARGKIAPNSARATEVLESIGSAHEADGVYIVGEDGIAKSSWESAGGRNTGLDLKFRPYFQMAMKGKQNIYAAVSITTGKRSIYFSAPLFVGNQAYTASIGAVVARADVARLDKLLTGHTDIALLVSPQGVVFAGTRADWVGSLAGEPTPERLATIRELKQFGAKFETQDPALLPVAIDANSAVLAGNRYALASAKLQWNDPYGDWTLVLMENLARSIPLAQRIWTGAASALAVLLLCALLLFILRGQHAKALATRQLLVNAERQEALAQRKTQLADTSMRLQGTGTPEALAQVFLEQANRLLGVLQGAVYVVDAKAKERMTLAAGFGCAADLPETLAAGDGLLGQCALEGKPISIEAPTQTYWRISSGLGETMPRVVLVMPVLHKGEALGVVELAALRPLDADERSVLDELLPMMALNLEVVLRKRQTDSMAAATVVAERDLARMAEVERFNRIAQGREQRILEVKRLANELARKAGEVVPFPSLEAGEAQPQEIEDAVAKAQTESPAETKQWTLAELVDLGELQVLFSNFCDAIGVAAAIIDLEGKVLSSSRWQRACTDFHRVNPGSCARCIESDTDLALKLKDGTDFTMYTCKNGMTDCASPIIVEGRHLANVFIGQFHLRPPDLDFFAQQAKQFDYPQAEYLQAVSEAPVMDEKRLPVILGFLTGFSRMIATMSLARRRADEAQQRLQRERVAALSLAEDAEQARRALETRKSERKP